MKENFRQSMLWLHSWLGLSAGWIVYFVFFTGTAGYLHFEISRWMRPELPLVATMAPASDALAVAERYLAGRATNAEFWAIALPGQRGNAELAVSWRERPMGSTRADAKQVVLDVQTGEVLTRRARDTGGGTALYMMHYALHYIPRDTGTLIVGAAAMIMFVSILSGIVAHRQFFSEIFTFRPGRGRLSWRNGHTLLGVAALPFFLLMTWSGLLFFLFAYMPAPQAALFPDDDAMMEFNVQAYFPPESTGRAEIVGDAAAATTSLSTVLANAEALWGKGSVVGLRLDNPGRADARAMAHTRRAEISGETRATFDAATGAPIPVVVPRTAAAKVIAAMTGVHEGHFAWSYLRALYVVGGLAGTVLVATGLVHWSLKRRAAPDEKPLRRFGLATVEALNRGTIMGLPIGLAAYFWANRLLPVDLAARGAWEVNIMFITWGVAYFYAAVRPQARGWAELSGVAAVGYGLIPVLNALTTERHLAVTVPAGDWVLAGFDLAMVAAGIAFAVIARAIWRAQRQTSSVPLDAAAEAA